MSGPSPLESPKPLGVAHAPAPHHGRDRLSRLAFWGFLVVVLVVVAGLGVWSLIAQQPVTPRLLGKAAPPLPVYGTVPAFTLTERSGRPVRLEDLRGTVWIASFIFTHCPDECPLMTAEMARLQAEFIAATDLRLVSITVDPDRDTPAALSQYAAQFQADPQRWLFLTGDKRAIYQLAQEGFRLGISAPLEDSQGASFGAPTAKAVAWSPRPARPSPLGGGVERDHTFAAWLPRLGPASAWANHGRGGDIGHAARFILIDRQARIRGYYDGLDEAALQRLRRHTQRLLHEG